MIFEIVKCEEKGAGWKLVDIREAVEGGKEYIGVSVNEKDREGNVKFPYFSEIKVGATIEADYWKSATNGKEYLYAPRPKAAARAAGAGRSPAAITAAQNLKHEHIEEAQDRKEVGIKISGAMRDATLVTLAAFQSMPFPTDDEFKAEWKKWREFFVSEYDGRKSLPF